MKPIHPAYASKRNVCEGLSLSELLAREVIKARIDGDEKSLINAHKAIRYILK